MSYLSTGSRRAGLNVSWPGQQQQVSSPGRTKLHCTIIEIVLRHGGTTSDLEVGHFRLSFGYSCAESADSVSNGKGLLLLKIIIIANNLIQGHLEG